MTTRSSADADKPARLVQGQSRSRNIVPFHMLGTFPLMQRRAVFPIFDFKKCRDLEIRVRGHVTQEK